MLQFIWINVISIHALLAESDFANFEGFSWWVISIHALLAESDLMMLSMVAILILFLSTLSLRRATTPARMSSRLLLISIHALLAESDVNKIPNQCKIDEFLSTLSLRRATIFEHTIVEHFGFLSTLSLRRATGGNAVDHIPVTISIHALLAESDLRCWEPPTPGPSHFYPRSPCGERRLTAC